MNLDQLKAKVEEYRKGLKGKSGHFTVFSETGPVGMSLIDGIVAVLEMQEGRINDLEKKLEKKVEMA